MRMIRRIIRGWGDHRNQNDIKSKTHNIITVRVTQQIAKNIKMTNDKNNTNTIRIAN